MEGVKLKFPKKEIKALKEKYEGIPRFFTKADAEKLGDTVIDKMNEMIAKGVSPVQGEGRFERYSENYPNKAQQRQGKRKRPVNLYLTGDMLRGLKWRHLPDSARNFKNKIELYFSTSKGSGQDLSPDQKATANNEGSSTRPARRIFPKGGEKLAKTLQELILDHYREALNKYFRK